jgi:hypothetical protein
VRRPIRGNIRVGVPITLEPGPNRISPPKRVSTVYHGLGFAETPLRGQVQALRSHPRDTRSLKMVAVPGYPRQTACKATQLRLRTWFSHSLPPNTPSRPLV